MRDYTEMFEALLAGETLTTTNGSMNEYRLKDGRIEYRNSNYEGSIWTESNGVPAFDALQVKPKTILINDFEVPEPVRQVDPTRCECYWAPNFNGPNESDVISFFARTGWDPGYHINKYLSMGFIHLTKEDALLHRRAVLSFTAP
jgi:hypothetical protein